MPRTRALIPMILALLLTGTGLAYAAEGILACVARYRAEEAGGDTTNASIQLSNLDDNATIVIDDVFVYHMNVAEPICIGPDGWKDFPTVLGPNGGTWMSPYRLKTRWGDAVPDVGWLILKFYWSSDTKDVFPLFGRVGEIVREHGSSKVVGRSSLKCDTVVYSPGK